ncbi:MAG: hypothetical protein NC397_06085 [Clostridium sp.]|nr:hypothetical protein [Clostridium sp.]
MFISSDNKILADGFNWAVKKTPSFVVTGIKNGEINKGDGNKWYGPDGVVLDSPTQQWAKPKDYMPAFWAGYYDRTAYYIRDFVHQLDGACLLGLYDEIFNMYYTFASNANEQTGWFAPWAFNFDNSIYYMDTPNYKRFVRELTAQFELVEKAYALYLFTGDERYINDDTIFNFITNVMTKLVDSLDGAVLPYKNGIPEGKGDIFQGTSTYNERGFHAAEAGDSIGAMYAALIAFSNILKLRGNDKEAKVQLDRAERLKEYFNKEWSVVSGTDAFAYAVDNLGNKHYEWYKNGTEIHGGASCIFMPMKAVTYSGERNDKLIDYIFEKEFDENTREDNIESLTYLPDLFFMYHQNNRAWYWMQYILSQKDIPHERKSQGLNGDYPEISFTIISQVVNGLLGVSVNAVQNEITTCPHFPADIHYVRVDNIKFGENDVNISLYENKAILKNNGTKAIQWHCKFYRDGKVFLQTITVEPDEIAELYSEEK